MSGFRCQALGRRGVGSWRTAFYFPLVPKGEGTKGHLQKQVASDSSAAGGFAQDDIEFMMRTLDTRMTSGLRCDSLRHCDATAKTIVYKKSAAPGLGSLARPICYGAVRVLL